MTHATVTALLLGVTLGSVLAGDASAQGARVRAPTDSLVQEALRLTRTGDTANALALLERATDQSPRDVDALYWRGVVLVRTTELSLQDQPRLTLAWHLLSRAANIDGKNPRYLIELGRIRLRTPLLRVEAERYFRRALDVAESNGDPAQLAEVAYELGEIKRRRYLSGKDRWMYTTNLIFDPIAARRRLHWTREFLQSRAAPIEDAAKVDRVEAEEYFRHAVAALPTHEPSAIALMSLLYDQKRYDEMRLVGAPIVAKADAGARVLFASGLASYKLGRLAEADRVFERGLAALPAADRAYVLDLGRILRKNDSVRVAGLGNADRASTDSAFWEAADPMLATPENEARLEFLARMSYADLQWTDADMRQVGWQTDRALIIARYGEPPVIATFPPSSDADARDAVGRIITVWMYPRQEMEFVFMGPPAMNYATFAGNYRDFAEERREVAPFMLDNVPLAMSVDTIPVQMARFRGENASQVQLLVAASIDARTMYRNAEIDRSALELSLRLGQPSRLMLANADTVAVHLPVTANVPFQWLYTMRAADVRDLRVRVEARDPAVLGALGRAQTDMAPIDYSGNRLAVSDVVFAEQKAAPDQPMRGWADAALRPLAAVDIAQRQMFTVYWESYGLKPDAAGRVQFDLHIRFTLLQIDRGTDPIRNFFGNISDAVGLSPEGEQTLGVRSSGNEAIGTRDRVPGMMSIGLGSSPAGRYRMELAITDRNGGAVTRTQREFHIRRRTP